MIRPARESVAPARSQWLGTEPRAILLFLVAHVLVFTLVATLQHAWSTIHHDMAEAFVWGQEPQWGYYKHPPVSAWVAGAWFQLFPRTNWAFFLLSASNAAVGLAGAWALARRLLDGTGAKAALLLLCLTPFYNFLAMKYNANSILLSLWPWTAYAFVRSIEERSARMGVLFGVLAGLAMLGKYYSALLLGSCFLASLLHPEVRAYYRSAAPWLAMAAFALVISPHVWWAVENGLPTLEYAASKTRYPFLEILGRAGVAVLTAIAFHLLALLALGLAYGRRLTSQMSAAWKGLLAPQGRWLAVLALGPFVLTVASVLLANMRISAQFMIPIFFLLPVLVLKYSSQTEVPRLLAITHRWVVALWAVALISAPLVAYLAFTSRTDTAVEPRRELTAAAVALWQSEVGTPLAIVAGTKSFAMAISFYAPSHPSEFSNFSFENAPWISADRIAREGMLIACVAADSACMAKAGQFAAPGAPPIARSFAVDFLGKAGPPFDFRLFLVKGSGKQ